MNFLQRLMYGRYGSDQLNLFLLGVYVVLSLISSFLHLPPLGWGSTILIILACYRLMSRNIGRRQAENAKFLSLAQPVIQWAKLRRTIRRDQEHRYLKCPHCGQHLRVPRGKGHIHVTCRTCGTSFEAKS